MAGGEQMEDIAGELAVLAPTVTTTPLGETQ